MRLLLHEWPTDFDDPTRDNRSVNLFLCASHSSYHRVADVREGLERRGHVVTLPNNVDDPGREEAVKRSEPSDYAA